MTKIFFKILDFSMFKRVRWTEQLNSDAFKKKKKSRGLTPSML